MAIVKWSPNTLSPAWSPFAEFDTLRRELDRVFNTFWPFHGSDVASNHVMWTPRVDCMEKDDEYVFMRVCCPSYLQRTRLGYCLMPYMVPCA